MRQRGPAIAGLLLAVLAQVLVVSPAWAAAPSSELVLSTYGGQPGATFTATYTYTSGTNPATCPSGVTVSYSWNGQDVSPQPKPTLAGDMCQAIATIQMPAGQTPGTSYPVCAQNSTANTLRKCQNFVIDTVRPSPSPTPTPSPAASPTPTPSPSPSAGPSPSPVESPTPSPSDSPVTPAPSSGTGSKSTGIFLWLVLAAILVLLGIGAIIFTAIRRRRREAVDSSPPS